MPILLGMTPSPASRALHHWVDALNDRTPASLAQAVSTNIHIRRFGFGSKAGQLVEEIGGTKRVAAWIALTPPVARFTLLSEPTVDSADALLFHAHYRLNAGDFVGGGVWRFRLDAAGRIAWLEHHPDDLEDPVEESPHAHRHQHDDEDGCGESG